MASPQSPNDLWSVDESSLADLTRAVSAPPSDRAWFQLRRDAEELALNPGFDRLITLVNRLRHIINIDCRAS
jgi:hypothetical protein